MRLRSRTRRAAQRLAALIAVITLVLWPYERQRPDGLCGQRQGCIRVVNSEKWRPRALSPSRINRRLSPRVRCASDNACVSCAAQAITYHRECWQPCSSYAHSAPTTAAVRDGLAKSNFFENGGPRRHMELVAVAPRPPELGPTAVCLCLGSAAGRCGSSFDDCFCPGCEGRATPSTLAVAMDALWEEVPVACRA